MMQKSKEVRLKQIDEKIKVLELDRIILFAGAPLSATNPGQGYSLEQFRKAAQAVEEIERLVRVRYEISKEAETE